MNKKITSVLLILTLLFSMNISGCGDSSAIDSSLDDTDITDTSDMSAYELMESINTGEVNPIDDSYRNYYEIFPYSFCDSNGDGIGDINGITSQLDYIDELGCNGIWLTPVCSSPTYHKYDVTDYYSIDTDFGTMEDYENFISECEKRNIRVLFDLVVNHTSSQHPWFREACNYLAQLDAGQEPSSAECVYLDYYNFSQEQKSGWEKVPGTEWYYECQFWGGMPDLNLDSSLVRDEITEIVTFWLDKGVSGFRLDATTSYYTGENDKNIEFLTWLNTCIKTIRSDAYIVGECWENSVTYTSYYASGIDSFFDFDFADNSGTIAKVLQGGSALTYGNKIVSIQQEIKNQNPTGIDAAFSSNHDTGRSAGYYAGETSMEQTKLTQAMAMFIGGSYFLYYGDELGMKGSGDDENKRAPMQWADSSDDRMCDSIATREIAMKYGSLEEQLSDGNSIYYYVKEGLKLRNIHPEIAHGTTTVLEELSTENILVMEKEYEGSQLFVIFNLSNKNMTVDFSNEIPNHSSELSVVGVLLTGKENANYDTNILQLPPYSVVLLQ